ncbi:hypothetical protein HPB51_012706 [Rhipicephalus microplus]|uniref:Tick transposon n=1 Tax=Rhipicephalus microplus TaxID=6941 RepID=A0A9J6D575_RHIMP|nr:hypothetical protein HPB51_012706 [Rhipicephalus microplus]
MSLSFRPFSTSRRSADSELRNLRDPLSTLVLILPLHLLLCLPMLPPGLLMRLQRLGLLPQGVRGAGDCSQVTRDITSSAVHLSRASHPGPPFPHGVRSSQQKQATGKIYATTVRAPFKMAVSSTHPGQSGAQQRGPLVGPKQPDSTKPRLPAKAPSQPHVDQENLNLRLRLRAVADLLPPENQLRSICLQAAIKLTAFKATRVETAVTKLLSRGQGFTSRLTLRLYEGNATAAQTYSLPLVQLAPHRKEPLERQHHITIRLFLGLPRQPPIAAKLAEAQTCPLSLFMLRQALRHVNHLHRTPGGAGLLRRLRSRPAPRMAQICTLYKELVHDSKCPIQPPSPHQQPLDVHLRLDNPRKRRSPACELHQEAVAKFHHRLRRHLLVYRNGSVRESPHTAAAACVIPSTGTTVWCRLPFHASFNAAELVSLHLAANHPTTTLPQLPVETLCDSQPAVETLLQLDRAGMTGALLHSNLTAI